MTQAVTADWNALAPSFDEEPDHGLRDPAVRRAWREVLLDALPPSPASVADLACGTGTLSLLLAEQGYAVTGVDLADRMLDLARKKAGSLAEFVHGDVVEPPLPTSSFDVVLARHVLFALPDPGRVLARWSALLRPGGRLVLVEGFWSTGSGLHADDLVDLVERHRSEAEVIPLSARSELWGRPVHDERYLLVSRR